MRRRAGAGMSKAAVRHVSAMPSEQYDHPRGRQGDRYIVDRSIPFLHLGIEPVGQIAMQEILHLEDVVAILGRQLSAQLF